MDSIQLKQIEQLSNTDTTDKNKKDFEILQKICIDIFAYI